MTTEPGQHLSKARLRSEKTRQKILTAAGKLFMESGSPLRVKGVARHAGVDGKTVKRYFPDMDQLLRTYFMQKDYGTLGVDGAGAFGQMPGKERTILAIQQMFAQLQHDREIQEACLSELAGGDPAAAGMAAVRETFFEELSQQEDKIFQGSSVSPKAVRALLLAGCNFLALHAAQGGRSIGGIDLSQPEGREKINTAIRQIIDWSYQEVGEKPN